MSRNSRSKAMGDERQAFEQLHAIPTGAKWCEKRHIYIHKNYSGLVLHPINESWEAFCEGALWQASRQGVEGDGGQHIDDMAVDRFAEAMKQKLAKQRQKGYGGWNDKELCPDGRLQKYLVVHLGKGDPVDVGNFAMMIWNRGESVTDAGS
jgi:hypothetical protein